MQNNAETKKLGLWLAEKAVSAKRQAEQPTLAAIRQLVQKTLNSNPNSGFW